MTTAPRQLKITYGTTATGGTLSGATLTLHGSHSLSMGADDFSISYQVLVSGSTTALFKAGCVAFEDAMTTRRQPLLVQTLDSSGGVDQTLLDLTHTANKALNIAPELTKPGGDSDTNLSRLYEVTIAGGMPTKSGLSGLRSFDYDVRFSQSRRGELSIRGTYTAVSSTQAAAQYLASIAARVSSITSALGGVWELTEETYTPDDTDQIVVFTRTYKELIFAEGSSGISIATIVDQQLTIKTDRVGSEGKREERKMATITATYSAGIDKTQTTDLETVWADTIRPWVVTQIQSVAGDRLAVVSQSVDYDKPENRISATITANARTGSDTLSLSISEVTDIDMGKIFARTWPTSTPSDVGTATDSYVYQGPKVIQKTITTTETKLGAGTALAVKAQPAKGRGGGGGFAMGFGNVLKNGFSSPGMGMFGIGSTQPGDSILDFSAANAQRKGGGGSAAGASSGGGQAAGILIRFNETVENRSMGLPGEQLDVYDKTTIQVYEFINAITGTTAGGDKGGTRT